MSYRGKLNIYVCQECRGHIVTKDTDEGVTPFMIRCYAAEGCPGTMVSSMYRVFDQSMRPDYEWYYPAFDDPAAARHRDHLGRGGLILRKPELQEAKRRRA